MIWQLPKRTLAIERPLIMGILNATPDSFSDGGQFPDSRDAALAAMEMIAEGADIIDVGGESTRPGATPVPPEEEERRIIGVVEMARSMSDVPISVDTRHASVARAALKAGADIINDVSSLADPEMADVVREYNAALVLMHGYDEHVNGIKGKGGIEDVKSFLQSRLSFAQGCGIPFSAIALDPGFGFGKDTVENISLLKDLRGLEVLDRPILAGLSRKRFIGEITGERDPQARDSGSLCAMLYTVFNGAAIVRVHNVRAAHSVLKVADVFGKCC